MSIKALINIACGTSTIPKGTVGSVKAVSNSLKIKEQYSNTDKISDWFYIVRFIGFGNEVLCTKEQLDFK